MKRVIGAATAWSLACLLLTGGCELDEAPARIEYTCSCTVDCSAQSTTFPFDEYVCAEDLGAARKKARNNCEYVFASQCGTPECSACTCVLSTRPNPQDC